MAHLLSEDTAAMAASAAAAGAGGSSSSSAAESAGLSREASIIYRVRKTVCQMLHKR